MMLKTKYSLWGKKMCSELIRQVVNTQTVYPDDVNHLKIPLTEEINLLSTSFLAMLPYFEISATPLGITM